MPTVKFDPNAERIHDVDRRQRRQETALEALTARVVKLEAALRTPAELPVPTVPEALPEITVTENVDVDPAT